MRSLFALIIEVLGIRSRASVAERYYEEHKRRCGGAGSDRALTRWTLHRAVFDKLTGNS